MVVLRACGVGPGRLAGYVLVPTMVVVGAVATQSFLFTVGRLGFPMAVKFPWNPVLV